MYAEGGPKCLVQVLTAMSGLNINHFIAMDFDGFEKVVRAIGGVEVCSTVPLYDYELGWILRKKGPKTQQPLRPELCARPQDRDRGNGDYGRIKRQQLFMSSLLRSTLSGNVLSTRASSTALSTRSSTTASSTASTPVADQAGRSRCRAIAGV